MMKIIIFTEGDVLDALQLYKNSYINYPRAAVEYRSGISVPANKRNGRKQSEHIRLMNFIRDEINGNKEWRNKDGRPKKENIVHDWIANHPDGTPKQCIKETGISKNTVYKYWLAVRKNGRRREVVKSCFLFFFVHFAIWPERIGTDGRRA